MNKILEKREGHLALGLILAFGILALLMEALREYVVYQSIFYSVIILLYGFFIYSYGILMLRIGESTTNWRARVFRFAYPPFIILSVARILAKGIGIGGDFLEHVPSIPFMIVWIFGVYVFVWSFVRLLKEEHNHAVYIAASILGALYFPIGIYWMHRYLRANYSAQQTTELTESAG